MRSLVIIVFLITSLSRTYGQSFNPFPTENTSWETVTQFMDPGNPSYSYEFDRTDGDTLINGQLYTKINRLSLPSCFIRETNGFVYCKYSNDSPFDTTEFLLYNFNLQLGDTMQMAMAGYELMFTTGHVEYVDSLLIGSQYHKQIGITGWHHIDFVEGIGSLQGLFYPEIPWVDWMADLNCFSANDTIYSLSGQGTTEQGNCLQLLNVQETQIDELQVFPNPTHDYIEIKGQKIAKAELYSINGQILLETTLQKINISPFKTGIYLLKLYFPDRTVENFKIVKK